MAEAKAAVKVKDVAPANGAVPLEIKIDLDNLLIGDLETLDRAGKNDLPMTELVGFLEKVVVDGVRHLPMSRLGIIIEALTAAIGEASNPAGN